MPVKVSAICSTDSIRLAVDSSTVHFRSSHAPTDVVWTLQATPNVDSVRIVPDASAWPFDKTGGPPFPVGNGKSYTARGDSIQNPGHYHYSITMMCDGKKIIFDPDIWVD